MQSTVNSPTVQIGSRGTAVKELQTLVNQRVSRDYAVVVDGDFGPKTERAVKVTQRIYFLVEDGIVGPKTWKALRAGTPADMPVLKMGSEGSLVKRVQEVLNEGTNFKLTTDGIFGPKTEKAVKQFQSSPELDAQGRAIVGPKTWNSLSGKVAFFMFD
jgi:peptidoglycan hydrolase-like protein with peptidoglycan-binding domain